MIPISKAIRIVERKTPKLGCETIRLSDSIGRVLAEDVRADSDMPPFHRSQMDGYAVKAKDTANAPVTLQIVGESAAGRGWHQTLKSGQAVRIMTGAPLPEGADAVQKIELTSESGDVLTVNEPTEKGRYIVRRAAEIKKGERLFRAGERVNERTIASLASFGYAKIDVAKQPVVSILATGSEIVPVDKTPGPDQIRNSNSTMLKALCEQVSAKVKIVPQTGDDLEKLKQVISKAVKSNQRSQIADRNSQILILTGGVSVGKYDLTKAALRELGAEMFFERVRLRPGKPTVFARLGSTLVFGLPGNPVSAAVTFYLFVRPALLKLQSAASPHLPAATAVLGSKAKGAKERDTYLPATLATSNYGNLVASPLRWHGSSDFVGFAQADALIFIPQGEVIAEGQTARILIL